jgi:NTP pyrophosphatase (non-canonical NTP hydrolase)
MKKLESKQMFYQTDDVDGQIYLHDSDVTGECGEVLVTVLKEERTSKPMHSPIDVKDLIAELNDVHMFYKEYSKSSYDSHNEIERGLELIIKRVKNGVLNEKC